MVKMEVFPDAIGYHALKDPPLLAGMAKKRVSQKPPYNQKFSKILIARNIFDTKYFCV